MTKSISIQHRIGEINYHLFNVRPGLGDNFSIRLAHRLAEAGDLNLAKIKKAVNGIDTVFFKNQYGGKNITREEYARVLYDDLKRCELLNAPPVEIPQAEHILKMALFEILEAANIKQARVMARKALKQVAAGEGRGRGA